MFYEYALEPQVLRRWESFRYFIEKFGFDRGRVIAEFPSNWKARVRDCIAPDCGAVERLKIIERLHQLNQRHLVKRPGAVWSGGDWLPNAEREHVREPFRAIVARSNPRRNDAILESDPLDEQHERFRVPTDLRVPRTAEAIATAISLLLRMSKRVVLIDPYFSPAVSEKRNVISAIARQVAPGASFDLHAGNVADTQMAFSAFRLGCETKLPGELPPGCVLRLCRWQQKQRGEKLHNRYVLTDVGGVELGIGLEEGSPGETDRLSLVSDELRTSLLSDYTGSPGAFQEDGPTFSIAGTVARPGGRAR